MNLPAIETALDDRAGAAHGRRDELHRAGGVSKHREDERLPHHPVDDELMGLGIDVRRTGVARLLENVNRRPRRARGESISADALIFSARC